MPRKADAEEIEAFLDDVGPRLRLAGYRQPWPKYAWRFDDVVSVANILRCGRLYSRLECDRRGIAHHDAANPGIIQQTSYAHRFVRMYFRPRTPTQFHMEGILTPQEIENAHGAHCPVPVFLLFDAKELFVEQGVQFTDGNMARAGQYRIGDSAEFLRSIPFDRVYHDGSLYGMDGATKSDITFRRNAEVIVETEMELGALKAVMCRTGSERDTLLELLGDAAGAWAEKIRICPPTVPMFNRNGMFVESATLVGEQAIFGFSPARGRKYSFDVKVTDAATGAAVGRFTDAAYAIPTSWRLGLRRKLGSARIVVTIEGCTAFAGVLTQNALVGG